MLDSSYQTAAKTHIMDWEPWSNW